mmetsp:Transcript_43658/g.83307  ORF Transcript_43658/g.83307 Transcript_43658/m.83307 type:complete len:458 (+) Transcript_43658:80-1453(+)
MVQIRGKSISIIGLILKITLVSSVTTLASASADGGSKCTADHLQDIHESLLEKFVVYCKIHSTADEKSNSLPSSPGQWDMIKVIQNDLLKVGVPKDQIEMTSQGYLIANLPATPGWERAKKVALFSHVDTARDFEGSGVEPVVHHNYDGNAIRFPKDENLVLDPKVFPVLKEKIGDTIVTASGDTLLGADDKAGVAVMVALAQHLTNHKVPHGPVALAFGPDEEIGHGMKELDLERLGADVGYTLDAELEGEIQFETFSADRAVVHVTGLAIHPCCAKDKLVNALYLLASLVAELPREGMSPETTEGRQGFVHPYSMEGTAASAQASFVLRDFELDGLEAKRQIIRTACDAIQAREPRAVVNCTFIEQYRNMRYWLDKDMRAVEIAEQAMQHLGIEPKRASIRGGTDGAQLTARGLPTPNLYTGWHNAHGPLEWASINEMGSTLQVLLEILELQYAA